MINSYKDLKVWQKGIELVDDIYELVKKFPSGEKYGIVSQITRSAVSVPSNIAEGWGRESTKSYDQFLKIARGSLFETETLLIISEKQSYISQENSEKISKNIDELSKMLNSLIRSLENKIKE